MKTPCKLWDGYVTHEGYGRGRYKGVKMSAHRMAILKDGRALSPSDVVRHTCDNRQCVEPTHLIVGTQSENEVDKSVRSKRHTTLKLWPEQVREIRGLLSSGVLGQRDIATLYGVSQRTITCINRGITWSHVQ